MNKSDTTHVTKLRFARFMKESNKGESFLRLSRNTETGLTKKRTSCFYTFFAIQPFGAKNKFSIGK